MLMASETMEQHFKDIQELLKRCKENKLHFFLKKMMLGRQKVEFAGYMVEIEFDTDKIQTVNQFLTPSTGQDLKSFIGLINQFRQFNQL